jgi:hypothetical protein
MLLVHQEKAGHGCRRIKVLNRERHPLGGSMLRPV